MHSDEVKGWHGWHNAPPGVRPNDRITVWMLYDNESMTALQWSFTEPTEEEKLAAYDAGWEDWKCARRSLLPDHAVVELTEKAGGKLVFETD